MTVPHKVLSNASIARAATNSPVVIGGSTTVPSDATSVAMTVAVKSTAAGSLSIFPADHPASTTVDAVGFPAGSVVVTHVTEQSPGLSGKVSFRNNGTATATVTVTITGYSTQTTASNISGSGGIAGQVLTNTGTGAVWAPATSPLSFTPLTVLSPWTNGFLASGAPGYAVDGYGVVHLQGEIELYSPCVAAGDSSPVAFVMPLAIRPTVTLYLTANEYGGATGRIEIQPNGNVTVQADPSPPVPCVLEFVSLSGITYTLPY